MNDLVTVVIPTFNRHYCVGRAIESVLAQTHPKWELIVVDDGSTDGTPERLASFGDAIKVIRQTNQGPSAARNAGIRAARGEFVAFLDSDDEWMPDKLERQLDLMRDSRVIVAATNWRTRDAGSRTGFDSLDFTDPWVCHSPTEFVSRQGGHHMTLPSWLVRRKALLPLGGFNPSLVLAEDNDLLFRLAFVGSFALTRKVLVMVGQKERDAVQLSCPGNLEYHRNLARAMSRAAANACALAFSEPKRVQRQFARIYGYWLRQEMEFAALDGRNWAARQRALEALIHRPARESMVLACMGFMFPSLVGRRTRSKYSAAHGV